MFLFVFAGAKRRSGEIAKFQFWHLPTDTCHLRVATFNLQKVPESAGDSGVFPYLFCCATFKPGLWIKTKFGNPAFPWNEPLTTKNGGITIELCGKNN